MNQSKYTPYLKEAIRGEDLTLNIYLHVFTSIRKFI